MSGHGRDELRTILRAHPALAEEFVEELITKGAEAVLKVARTGNAVTKRTRPGELESNAARILEAEAQRILNEAERTIRKAAAEASRDPAPAPRRSTRSVRAESEDILERMGKVEQARDPRLTVAGGIAKALERPDGKRAHALITDAMRLGEEDLAASATGPTEPLSDNGRDEALELARRINQPNLDVAQRRQLLKRLQKLVDEPSGSTRTFAYPPAESAPPETPEIPETLSVAEIVRRLEREPDPRKREVLMRRLYDLGEAV